MEKGCFVIRDRERKIERFPLFDCQIDEIQFRSGNMVSTGALASCGFWGTDCLFLTQKARALEIETLINEEAYLFAMCFRNEKSSWIPRIANLSGMGKLINANENSDECQKLKADFMKSKT